MTEANCPMDRDAVIDRYFLENRAKLIDLAAFLDRIDRAGGDAPGADDFRVVALRKAVEELLLLPHAADAAKAVSRDRISPPQAVTSTEQLHPASPSRALQTVLMHSSMRA